MDKLRLTAITTELLQSLQYRRPSLTVFNLLLPKKQATVKDWLVCRTQFDLYLNTLCFFVTCTSSILYENLSIFFQIYLLFFPLCFNLNFGKGFVRCGPYYMKPLHSLYHYAYSMANIYHWNHSLFSCLRWSPSHLTRLNGRRWAQLSYGVRDTWLSEDPSLSFWLCRGFMIKSFRLMYNFSVRKIKRDKFYF